jgi:ribulose-5-phosphate 4-epimerase/fuculose-1-phosphate aldolase
MADLLLDLVVASRTLAEHGVIDAYGHASARSETNPQRYFMARNLAPELVTREDILEYDLDSNAIDANGRALYKERFIHGEIYKARPDVKAIVHNHSPTVVPFACTGHEMRRSSTCPRSSAWACRRGTSATRRRAPTCWCRARTWARTSRSSSRRIRRC